MNATSSDSYLTQLVCWFRAGNLAALDWAIIVAYCIASLAIGLYFTRRSSKSMAGYFVSERSMAWWLLGTSMIATSFASDTPLVITSYIRASGMQANWMWMGLAVGQLLAVFSFSLFWRRAEVITDNQLIEMRYSGKPAAILRGFKATFGATIYNFIVMGWVLTAMGDVSQIVIGIPKVPSVVIFSVITLLYCMTGGLWAVVWTDLFQFIIMMGGTIVLAVYAVNAVGGLESMRNLLVSAGVSDKLDILPPTAAGLHMNTPLFDFLIFILVSWWASPSADGGGYMIQRMAGAKDERHSRLGLLWFVVGTYALRLWPWVLVAAVSLILFPTISDPRYAPLGEKAGFPLVMNEVLKSPGLIGLMITVFIAAFMSTISTHVNWGASYLINDLYRRFMVKHQSERHYVVVSYAANVVVLGVAGYVALHISTIERAWEFVRSLAAGVGAVLILRWFWWRINAWTEIASLATSLVVTVAFELAAWFQQGEAYLLFKTPLFYRDVSWTFSAKLFVIIPLSLGAGIIATLLTAPTDRARLVEFFRKVRPGGAWGNIPAEAGVTSDGLSWRGIVGWLLSVGFIYTLTFGIGKLLFGPVWLGWALLAASALFGLLTWLSMKGENHAA